MTQSLRDRLLAKGITLPNPSSPGANYRQDRLEGRQLFIAGQLAHCLSIGVYVNATENFLEHSQVANGASDPFLEALGEAGQHTRMAIGVSGLPYGVAVEVEGLFALKG